MRHWHESLDWAELVSIEGRFDSESAPEVEKALLDVLGGDAETLLVDVSDVTLLASAGLRTLLVATKEASKLGKKSVLVGPTPTARRVLQISRLDSVLTVADDLEAARELVAPPEGT